MLVRRETVNDIDTIRAVTAAAFTVPGEPDPPVEARLVDELRADAGWLPALSLVAVDLSGTVIGHVVATRGRVGDVSALGLGPLSVHPDHQRGGVGSALMHAVLGAADALDEPLVALLGDPAYYARFGFRVSTDLGITPPDPAWGRHFQVRTMSLYHDTQRGEFTYAEPFHRL